MKHKEKKASSGFTLIELITVVLIIGILAAIFILQSQSFRQTAFDARAKEDLTNVAHAEEAYFVDYSSYLGCANTTCTALPGIVSISAGVEIEVFPSAQSFTATAKHRQGSGVVFFWDNVVGGLQ